MAGLPRDGQAGFSVKRGFERALLILRMQQIYADYEVEAVPGYNAESAVAKNWISQNFGVPAITFEIGDETPRDMINALSVIAAEEMMTLLLSLEN